MFYEYLRLAKLPSDVRQFIMKNKEIEVVINSISKTIEQSLNDVILNNDVPPLLSHINFGETFIKPWELFGWIKTSMVVNKVTSMKVENSIFYNNHPVKGYLKVYNNRLNIISSVKCPSYINDVDWIITKEIDDILLDYRKIINVIKILNFNYGIDKFILEKIKHPFISLKFDKTQKKYLEIYKNYRYDSNKILHLLFEKTLRSSLHPNVILEEIFRFIFWYYNEYGYRVDSERDVFTKIWSYCIESYDIYENKLSKPLSFQIGDSSWIKDADTKFCSKTRYISEPTFHGLLEDHVFLNSPFLKSIEPYGDFWKITDID